MASLTEKMLGQLAPANTTAASLYSVPASTRAVIRTIIVCNTTAGAVAYRIFYHDSGTTYSAATALYYDVAIAANTTHTLSVWIATNNSSGHLAVRTDTANALCFSCFGTEIV